ncbi:hypothetical protein F3J14_35505, partial [Burkholderia sp. Tr-862]|nr:hypothetical protein [Burkholderia sp. Tr-862]
MIAELVIGFIVGIAIAVPVWIVAQHLGIGIFVGFWMILSHVSTADFLTRGGFDFAGWLATVSLSALW